MIDWLCASEPWVAGMACVFILCFAFTICAIVGDIMLEHVFDRYHRPFWLCGCLGIPTVAVVVGLLFAVPWVFGSLIKWLVCP